MKQPRNRKEKINLLKRLLAGKLSVKEHLTPKLFTLYSVTPGVNPPFDREGYLLNPEPEKTGEPLIWVNVINKESNIRFALPHNHRDRIHSSQIKQFN